MILDITILLRIDTILVLTVQEDDGEACVPQWTRTSTCRDARTQSLAQINTGEDAPGCSRIHGPRKTGGADVTVPLAVPPRRPLGRSDGREGVGG